MTREELLRAPITPIGAPGYQMGKYYFKNREFLNILFRTDIEAIRKIVPEPLEIEDPLVRFEVINMPDSYNLGNYCESGLTVKVNYKGEKGEYVHSMYLNNVPAILSGREAAAFPKKEGSPRLFVEGAALMGTLDYGSTRIATASMVYKHREMDKEEALKEITVPSYMLKTIPGYDRSLRICELTRSQITDIEILGAWTGPARLQFFQHVLAPMADLPVKEIVGASHIITNMSLGVPEVIVDYLK